jgi:hypothetical protein
MRLDTLCESPRFRRLDKLDAYFAGTQYRGLKYNWDGAVDGAESVPTMPGFNVPLSARRPRLNLELAKRAVKRFTAMLFGEGHFPSLIVEDDEDASDYVNELARESQLALRLNEARDKGGACGTACVSFAFVAGKPRLEVHRAKHIDVVEWADRGALRPAVAIKAYKYMRSVIDPQGKPVEKAFYYARRWDMTSETVWDPIPEEIAKLPDWESRVRSIRVEHNFGFAPIYLTQNQPDSEQIDGLSDYDQFEDDFDEINRLVSATSKGTIANVDPTLVIHMDPTMNQGSLKKGSDNAIFSKDGAEYLELRGDSIKTAVQLAKDLIQSSDDGMGLVVPGPDAMSAAKSAAAMRMIFAPMTAAVGVLREVYGAFVISILKGMLQASRTIGQTEAGDAERTADGELVQHRPSVVLEPRVDREASGKVKLTPRVPGVSSRVTLGWPAFFPPTPTDSQALVEATLKAKGVLISDRTAVRSTAAVFDVEDIEGEVEQIEEEAQAREAKMMMQADSMGLGVPAPPVVDDSADSGEDDE